MKYFLLFLCFSFNLQAQDMDFDKETGHIVPKYVGEIKSFKGTIYRKKGEGRLLEVKPGTRFFKDDTLITEDKSVAKVLIVDDTQLTVGPNSEIKFADFKFVSKSNRKILYNLVKGQLKGNIVNKAQNDDVIFRTRNATLGVRGTKILINHRTLNNLEVSEFALESGSAEVSDNIKNIKHELLKHDRVIVLNDRTTNEMAAEKNKLSTPDIDVLKEEDEMMPFYDLPSVQPSSTLFTLLNQAKAPESELETERSQKKDKEPKGTLHNLDKLNEKLRENQKKTKQ